MLDASAAGAALAPLGDLSEFVQVGEMIDSSPPQTANGVANGEESENTPPDNLQIVALDDVFENGIAKLSFSFDDPDFEDTHIVEIDWGDGTAPETINLSPGERFVSTTHQYLDDNPTGTPLDVNQVQITVTDSYGDEVSGSAPINVINVAPKIDSLSVTSPINENDFVELQLTFTDPGSLDTHTVEIDWGDGTPIETINLTSGERFVQTPHQYLDDNPTFTPSDMYQVKVTVTDDDTGADSASEMVEVKNVAPVVTIEGAPTTSPEGTQIDLTSTLIDPGTLDTFAYAWDVTVDGNLYASGANPTFSFTPADDGMYVVTLTVSDDDFGIGTDEVMVSVTNVDPKVILNPVMMINENGSAVLSGAITDVGTLDTFELELVWGDVLSPNNSQTFMLGTTTLTEAVDGVNWNPTTREFSLSHTYLDDNPTFTPSDTYVIGVTVTDDDAGADSASEMVVVKNVAPVVTIEGEPDTSPEGTQIDLTSMLIDPGTLDTFAYAWDVTTNGNLYASSSTPTFSFTPADNGLYVVTLTVSDDDFGIDVDEVEITIENVDPMLDSVEDQSTLEGSLFFITTMKFSDPGFTSATANTMETFTYDIDWGDGTVETMQAPSSVLDGSPGTPTTGMIDDSHTYADNGVYTVTVTVRDDDGGSGTQMFDVTVGNVDPILVGIDSIPTVKEGQEFTLAELGVRIQDPGFDNPLNPNNPPDGSMETFVGMKVVWGDGTEDVLMVDNAGRTVGSPGTPTLAEFIHTPHTYADNGPAGTGGKYTVTVTVRDDDGEFVTRSFEIQVDNVDPLLTLTESELIVNEGDELDLSGLSPFGPLGTFSDPGFDNPGNIAYPSGESIETFTYSIDWGDGTPIETMLVPATTVPGSPGVPTIGTLAGKHTYADNDADSFFTIKVTLTDDDGGSSTVEMIPVRVNNVNPVLEPLIATDVSSGGKTTLTLTFDDPGIEAEFLESGKFPFNVLVDWGDNLSEPDLDARFEVAEVHTGPAPKTFVIVHKYDGPPDPLHPAADIIIRVKIRDDDFGNPLIVDVGESNLEIIAISNPGIGAEPFRIDTTPQVPRLQFGREVRSDLLLGLSNSAEASLQGAELRAVSTDSKATTESVLELRVIDSYGVESDGIRLKSEVLNNLPDLFLTLPDNHYAIYLVRIETATERLVIEVYVRNGKVIDPSDDSEGTRDRPPTDEAVRDRVEQILEKNEIEPGNEIHAKPIVEPDDRGAMLPPGGLLPVAAGLVATGSFGSWAQQIDRAVAQAEPKKWRDLRQRNRKKWKNR